MHIVKKIQEIDFSCGAKLYRCTFLYIVNHNFTFSFPIFSVNLDIIYRATVAVDC